MAGGGMAVTDRTVGWFGELVIRALIEGFAVGVGVAIGLKVAERWV